MPGHPGFASPGSAHFSTAGWGKAVQGHASLAWAAVEKRSIAFRSVGLLGAQPSRLRLTRSLGLAIGRDCGISAEPQAGKLCSEKRAWSRHIVSWQVFSHHMPADAEALLILGRVSKTV